MSNSHCQFISRASIEEHKRLYPDLSALTETAELPKPEPAPAELPEPEWTPAKLLAITGVWVATATTIIVALFESL
jgi:hypothetical protein